jgi:hypothetical protein
MRFTLKISLLFCAFACCLYANDENRMNVISKSDKNIITDYTTKELPEDFSMDGNIDSTEKYNYLIAYENADARYAQNIVGMVIGGTLTGIGAYFLVGGIYYGWYYKSDDASDVVFTKISGGVLLAASIPFLVIGIPVLTANIYYYNVHKNHAIKRDKYRESLKLYKQRKESENSDAVQLMIIPSVNFANASGGVNLLVAF